MVQKLVASGKSALVFSSENSQNLLFSDKTLMNVKDVPNKVKDIEALPVVIEDISDFKDLKIPSKYISLDFDNLATFSAIHSNTDVAISGLKSTLISFLACISDKESKTRLAFTTYSLQDFLETNKCLTNILSWLSRSNQYRVSSLDIKTKYGKLIEFGEESKNFKSPITFIEVSIERTDGGDMSYHPNSAHTEFYITQLDRTYLHVSPEFRLSEDKKKLIFFYNGEEIFSENGVTKFSFRLIEEGLINLWIEKLIVMVPEFNGQQKKFSRADLDLYVSHLTCFCAIALFIYVWLNISSKK